MKKTILMSIDLHSRQWQQLISLFILIVPLLLWADPNFVGSVKRAEKLFYEKLYGDALPLYSQLLPFVSEEELKIQLTLRLASCYLEERNPQTALALLSPLENSLYRHQSLFLMSLAYRQLGASSQALNLLQQCSLVNSEHAKSLIALEKGYHEMRMGNLANAKLAFESIPRQATDSLPYDLAQLQLAKIFLTNGQSGEALQLLSFLSNQHFASCLDIERECLKGWAFLANQQESQAVVCFENLLPKALAERAQWSTQILNGLIMSYLRLALVIDSSSLDQLNSLFSKTERALQRLLSQAPFEASYLLLSDFYLIKAKCLSDSNSYIQAQDLLNRPGIFTSQEGFKQALLKRAAAAPSYQERNQLYEQLSTHSDYSPAFRAKAWFLKGLNDFEEGLRCQKEPSLNPITQPFEQAVHAFIHSIQLEEGLSSADTASALKYLAFAYAHLSGISNVEQAWETLNQLIENESLLSTFEHPEEIYCLTGWIALHLKNPSFLKKARMMLQQGQTRTGSSSWKERCLKLEGFICLQLEEWQQADLIFERLLQEEIFLLSHGEAWFWRAYIAEQQNHLSLKKEYLQQVYTQYPQSPYAPIAYFRFYSYREYMQGERKAIKHLQAMPLVFPLHPLLMSVYYLMGLDGKKNHLSEEGQVLRRRDWTSAIDAFQLAESTFDSLFENHLIPASDLIYFIQVRYRSQLERAKANLAIAQHSTGGKKQIYLEYAENVFKQLIQDFTNPEGLAKKALVTSSSLYPKIWAEAELQLAKTYEEKKEWQEAETILNESLKHYQQAQISQGYGLMHVWYDKGKLAQKQLKEEAALQCFLEAEKATREILGLNPHEKLNLWIQQSLCYQSLHQLDQAMRLLSRVINEDVISPLRIKAMFLRAEIYEQQERPELAIKQLEATASKGGEWAQKAQEKLEQVYGY